MTSIDVYDIEAQELEEISNANGMSIAEVVELLMEFAEEMK